MRKYSAASATSPIASAFSGLPWSRVSRWASSSLRFSMASAMRCSRLDRSNALSLAMSVRARCAASTARCASARVPFGTWAMISPVAGLSASKSCPLSDSTHFPSTNIFFTDRATSIVISVSVLPKVKGTLVDLTVGGGVDVARVADRLRVGEGLVREHRDLGFTEAELRQARDFHVHRELMHVLDRHLRRLPHRDVVGVETERRGHAREPLRLARVVVLHDRPQKTRGKGAVGRVMNAARGLAHRVRRA